jgi:hypothetical protein
MTARVATIALATLLLLPAGCSKSGPSPSPATDPAASSASPAMNGNAAAPQSAASAADTDAIRAAIEDHLRGNRGLNMDAMDLVIDSVAVNGNSAQAHASFHVKSNGATGMTMQYFLQRSGSGWVVTSGQPADGNTQLPPGHPSVNSTPSAPSMPDVDAFLKEHPAPKSN